MFKTIDFSKKILSLFMSIVLLSGTIGICVSKEFCSKAYATEAEEIANGVCGPDLTWMLDNNGVLKISGSGDMYNYKTAPNNPGDNSGTDTALVGYKYDSEGNCYYIDDKECWQENAGYNEIYDNMAPMAGMFIDQLRIRFTYGGKDWMVQMCKGQYGFLLVGTEIGLYTAPTGKYTGTVGAVNHYDCASQEDWLDMEFNCYWSKNDDGLYQKILSRPYDKYWWSTGFVKGQLTDGTNPISELKTKNRITFKSKEMADIFILGLKESGFLRASSSTTLGDDTYFQDGADVWFLWSTAYNDCFVGYDNSTTTTTNVVTTSRVPTTTKNITTTSATTTAAKTEETPSIYKEDVPTANVYSQDYLAEIKTQSDELEQTPEWNSYIDSIKKIIIDDGVTSIGNYAFSNCSQLEEVNMTDSITSIGNAAFFQCTKLKEIELSENTRTIGETAFFACQELTDLIIPDGVSSIGALAFYNCSALETITIPYSIVSIGESAFMNCSICNVYYTGDIAGWCNIDFADSLSSPMYYIQNFYIDGKLLEGDVVIPEGVTQIGNGAFRNWIYMFRSVTIPKTVKNIGVAAFGIGDWDGASGYHDVNFTGSEEEWNAINIEAENEPLLNTPINYNYVETGFFTGKCGDNLTWKISKLTGELTISGTGDMYNFDEYDHWYSYGDYIKTIKIEEGVTSIGERAFDLYNPERNKITISIASTVTNINACAFFGCEITDIVIPDGVTEIGSSAFAYCENLKNITIPNSIKSIGDSVFVNCYELTDVYYNGTSEQWNKIEGLDSNQELKSINIHFKKPLRKNNDNDDVIVECYDDAYEGDVYADITEIPVLSSDLHFILSDSPTHKINPVLKYDITIKDDKDNIVGHPKSNVTVKIKIPEGLNITEDSISSKQIKIYHYPKDGSKYDIFAGINQLKLENGYIVFEVEHFSYFLVCVETETPTIKICNNPGTATINYGDMLWLTAEATNLPEGAQVWWFFDSGFGASGNSIGTTVYRDSVVTVKILDSEGNVLKDADGNEITDTQNIVCKSNIWLRIISFFKNLFRIERTIIQNL